MRAGNQLVHAIPNTVEPPVNADLRFLYEDEQILVLHKPAPLPMHPCGRFNKNSLVPMLRSAFPKLEPRPVHRLDVDTTGVVVLAKDRKSARGLGEQFESRRVDKRYLAWIEGELEDDALELEGQVAREPSTSGKRRVSSDTQPSRVALTSLRALARGEGRSLVELRPHSGRTNQLRVQLADLGHPIVGDSAYGKGALALDASEAMSGLSDLCLHAWRLTFRHPGDGREMVVEAEPPQWGRRARIG